MTSGTFTAVPSSQFAEPTAVCPAGKVPLSGGVFSTTGGIGMVDSYPSDLGGGTLGWTVTVFNFDTVPDSVQAHAICITPPAGGLAAAASFRAPRNAAAMERLTRTE